MDFYSEKYYHILQLPRGSIGYFRKSKIDFGILVILFFLSLETLLYFLVLSNLIFLSTLTLIIICTVKIQNVCDSALTPAV